MCAQLNIKSCVGFLKRAKAKLLTNTETQDITVFAFMCTHKPMPACLHILLSRNIWQLLSDKEVIFPSTAANSNNLGRLCDLIFYLKMLHCNAAIQLFQISNTFSSSPPLSPPLLLALIEIFLHTWYWPKLFLCVISCNGHPNSVKANTINISIM